MNKKLKKRTSLVIAVMVFVVALVLFSELVKNVSHNGNLGALNLAIMAISIFIASLTYHWTMNKKSIQNDSRILWKYWLIGIVTYAALMVIIANQPKEALLGVISFIVAISMGLFGYLKYQQRMVETDINICIQEARGEYRMNYYIRKLLDYSLYAKTILSEKYLTGEGVEKDEDDSLYLAIRAYENSDGYINGYTVVKLKDTHNKDG